MKTSHECLEFVSQCCGASKHEYVETICWRCRDHSGFECEECGKQEEDFPVITLKPGEWRKKCQV